MIICHELKTIFIKAPKTAGTSFEYALLRYCGESCIVTTHAKRLDPFSGKPIKLRQNDSEETRTNAGYDINKSIVGDFKPHTSSEEICAQIGTKMFRAYHRVAIHRHIIDQLISRYYWENRNKNKNNLPSFVHWLSNNRNYIIKNLDIAPTIGPFKADTVLRYESLEADIKNSVVLPSEFYSVFSEFNAKGDVRDQASRDINTFLDIQDASHVAPKIEAIWHEFYTPTNLGVKIWEASERTAMSRTMKMAHKIDSMAKALGFEPNWLLN